MTLRYSLMGFCALAALAGCQSTSNSGHHSEAACLTGSVSGAVVGGLIGSTIGAGTGNVLAIAAGVGLGTAAGNALTCH